MKIDIARHIGAVTREVQAREHEGRPARVVLATRIYDSPVDDVWDAVTNPERIPRWFLPVSGDLRPGGRFQLQGNAGGEITLCEPPRNLGVTWEFGGGVSWVNVRLAEEGHSTRLELEHIAHDDEFWEQFGPGATGVGWDGALMGLGLYLDTGVANDPEASAAWMASEEGIAFMRGSSEAWREASVAAGTPQDEARAAADRTTAAYTGVTSS
jgi:uncharacterized protein YndB with AHSA1/START domain